MARELVVLTCGGAPAPAELAAGTVVAVPARPGRADVDPLLPAARRLVVVGDDADLAAVLLRLLRTERLDVELAHVSARPSAATRAWGLPHGDPAAVLARDGDAAPAALARDDGGGVVVGSAVVRGTGRAPLRGEAYCDDVQVFRGEVAELRVRPGPQGVEVLAVGVPRLRRLLPRRSGDTAAPPSLVHPGAVHGRALQVGSTGCEVVRDGVPLGRVLPRWACYRGHEDWQLVRPV